MPENRQPLDCSNIPGGPYQGKPYHIDGKIYSPLEPPKVYLNSDGTREIRGQREIALEFKKLPPLLEGFVRVVHITNPRYVEAIVATGLRYQALATTTAQAFRKERDVEYASDDPRFSFQGAKTIVFDVPNAAWNIHVNMTKSPGVIPAKYICGVVDSQSAAQAHRAKYPPR